MNISEAQNMFLIIENEFFEISSIDFSFSQTKQDNKVYKSYVCFMTFARKEIKDKLKEIIYDMLTSDYIPCFDCSINLISEHQNINTNLINSYLKEISYTEDSPEVKITLKGELK